MNDLPFIFYKPSLMFCDTAGMRNPTNLAHRQLVDYLWLRDGEVSKDNENLRKITCCAESDWQKVKGELMQNGWYEAGAFFLHRGAIKSLNESKEKYVSNHNKTAAANQKPRLELLPPDPVTGVTHYVTLDVTPHAASPVTPTHGHGEGEGEKQEVPLPNRPLIETVKGGAGGTAKPAPSAVNPATTPAAAKFAAGRVAGRIAANTDGWWYDNCKVPLRIATPARSIAVHLERYAAQFTETQIIALWKSAVTSTHQAVVDGMDKAVKSPGGYCIATFHGMAAALNQPKPNA